MYQIKEMPLYYIVNLFIFYFIFYLFIFLWYRGLNPGAFYLRATPPALFFILYFETGSHEVAEGLTK